MLGVGQYLHKGTVDVKHHRQHAAGHTGQNRPGADQDAAEQISQPMDCPATSLAHPRASSPLLYSHIDDSSFALPFQSNTGP